MHAATVSQKYPRYSSDVGTSPFPILMVSMYTPTSDAKISTTLRGLIISPKHNPATRKQNNGPKLQIMTPLPRETSLIPVRKA